MARTDLQRQVLQYMRGAPIKLELETSVLLHTLDELVARGDLELWKVGHPGMSERSVEYMSERSVEYRLTQQGRGPADGDEPMPEPATPKLPPLTDGGAMMLELLREGNQVSLSELEELISKGYLAPDQLKELIP